MQNKYSSVISLDDLLVKMNLGLSENEREKPQDIKISFKLFFEKPPASCESDDIDGTVCYNEVADIIKKYCSQKKIKLLEFLCFELYKLLRSHIDDDIKVWIKTEKCSPPIKGIVGATSFEYGDF